MSNELTIDERLYSLEQALRTSIIFNLNVAMVLGRSIAAGNESASNALANELRALKRENYEGINKDLHDGYVDNLVTAITGKA
ncbi:hypothetical protein [Pseudomonas viridiflava]|uniref:hypothetical protein n=1 Tax=Pseudomonas viridiflava TaxID=33069 RepID=UPI000F01D261|nr:hypothetical protein [Pseudomonas viridiflava]